MLLVEPERQTMPSNRSQWLDRHLERVCIISELTPTEFRNAEQKYGAVGRWIAAPGSCLAIFAPDVYPQGFDAAGHHSPSLRPQRVRS